MASTRACGPVGQRRLHGLLAGAAAGDQDLEGAVQEGQLRGREIAAEGAAHGGGSDEADAGPARVGARLVLRRDLRAPWHRRWRRAAACGRARSRSSAASARLPPTDLAQRARADAVRLLRPYALAQQRGIAADRARRGGAYAPPPDRHRAGAPDEAELLQPARSSALTAQTCSLIWHCCASARAKSNSARSSRRRGGTSSSSTRRSAVSSRSRSGSRKAPVRSTSRRSSSLSSGAVLSRAEAARGVQGNPRIRALGQRVAQRPGAGEVAQRQLGDELAVDGGVRERRLGPGGVERHIPGSVAAARQQRQPARRVGHPGIEAQGLRQARAGRSELAQGLLDDGQMIAVPALPRSRRTASAKQSLAASRSPRSTAAEPRSDQSGWRLPRCAACRHRRPGSRSGWQTDEALRTPSRAPAVRRSAGHASDSRDGLGLAAIRRCGYTVQTLRV